MNDEIVVTQDGRVVVGTQAYRDRGMAQLTGGAGGGSVDDLVRDARASASSAIVPSGVTPADLISAVGLGLVTWWSLGGPTWAGLASVALDDVAVPIVRRQYMPSAFGYRLDWAGLYATTPLVLYRLVKGEGGGLATTAAVAAPTLFTQYLLQATSWRQVALSSRGVLTLGTIIREWMMGRRK